MKYVNWLILVLISIALTVFSSAWVFNHVNAWAGFVVFFGGVYLILLKCFNLYKGIKNEKS